MDGKRWSPLCVFAGGCLTGAALIAVHSGSGSGRHASSSTRPADDWAELAELGARAGLVAGVARLERDPPPGSAAPSSVAEAPSQSRSQAQSQAEQSMPARSEPDAADAEKADDGDSIGDVLAALETEYRKRRAPAATTEPATAEPASPASASASLALPAAEAGPESAQAVPPAPVPAAAMTEALPSNATGDAHRRGVGRDGLGARATTAVDDDVKPTPFAAEAAARVASVGDEKAGATDGAQQQMAAQMQQLAALQQATFVEQQALLQYLQLLSLSPASRSFVPDARVTFPVRSGARGRGGRITAALPSSISDTDNPWGFDLKPAELVR